MHISPLIRQCPRGLLIEEFFQHDLEVRVASIFGKVVIAATDTGLKIDRKGQIVSDDFQVHDRWIR